MGIIRRPPPTCGLALTAHPAAVWNKEEMGGGVLRAWGEVWDLEGVGADAWKEQCAACLSPASRLLRRTLPTEDPKSQVVGLDLWWCLVLLWGWRGGGGALSVTPLLLPSVQQYLYVADLARKDKRVLRKKYQIYFW